YSCSDPFGVSYVKIGTIQRRLAWPLHKDDTLFRSGRPTGLNIYFFALWFDVFATGREFGVVRHCGNLNDHRCLRFEPHRSSPNLNVNPQHTSQMLVLVWKNILRATQSLGFPPHSTECTDHLQLGLI
ncbi:hypothetical protein L218DRAFT_1055249, partial [Marasmius fiardii PR-910]